MFVAGNWSNPVTKVTTDLLSVKRGDLECPVIPISIGMVDFPEALCDFGSSVNIMPRVFYEKFFTYPLSETTMYFAVYTSDDKFSKRNIEEPLCPSWYLIRPSRHRGDRDR